MSIQRKCHVKQLSFEELHNLLRADLKYWECVIGKVLVQKHFVLAVEQGRVEEHIEAVGSWVAE